jgi:hypothetical protein
MDAKDILRSAEELLSAASTNDRIPEPWSIVLAGLGAGAGLAADVLEHQLDPVIAIEEFRSIVPGYTASRARLRDYIDQLAKQGA